MASSVTVQRCTHMPIHSIWTCSNTFYIYNTDVEIKWVELYRLNNANTSLFAPPSPHYPNLVQLDGQQCNSARVHPYAYPRHMNMLKHFPYINDGCEVEVSGVVQPQPCQCTIVSAHNPQITQIWFNLMASSVTVQGCTHMPIHSIWTCSNTFHV